MGIFATKTYVVDFSAKPAGNGLWGLDWKSIADVRFNRIDVEITSYDDGEFYANIDAHHNCNANVHGLCYTDSGIETVVDRFIATHPELSSLIYDASGSEQGMQGRERLNMDANVRKTVTLKLLQELDFEIEVN